MARARTTPPGASAAAAAAADRAVLRILLLILGAIAVAGWLAYYAYVIGLACAFGSPNGNCRMPWPWQLAAEDMTYLVVLPLLPAAGLFLAAWLVGRRRG